MPSYDPNFSLSLPLSDLQFALTTCDTSARNEAELRGQVQSLSLEAEARAHLWMQGDDQDRMLQLDPVVAQLSGPLQGGQGRFSFLHLPFSLLALAVPVPSALRGAIGATGSYDLSGAGPLLTTELALEQARFGEQELR